MQPQASIPASFHPLVARWFSARYGEPTAVQAETWERVSGGEHVMAVAPTGSGKTLAAFLHSISCLVSGEYPPDRLSVLYISPLKALNEDIRKNLLEPLAELEASAREFSGTGFPDIRVATRSGDTPAADRRRFLVHPPSILCTTPESLAILLDSPRARPLLAPVRLVVLDEIHAVAGTKRGSLLACSVGRLALLAGEFTRIILSATVRPKEEIARFAAGYLRDGLGRIVPRPVAVVDPGMRKAFEISVEWPGVSRQTLDDATTSRATGRKSAARGSAGGREGSRYDAVVPAMLARIRANRSTLVFCDSRRRTERIAFLLNELGGEGTAYAHHGSLSPEVRRLVEDRLRAGELSCVVATASLELGIDIGCIDEVLFAGTPGSVGSALQRAGRAGHAVRGVPRVRVYPMHGFDLLYAAVVSTGMREASIEATIPPRNPLDVLAQTLLAFVLEGGWTGETLFDVVRTLPPFTDLDRAAYDSVLGLLAGDYHDGHHGALRAKIVIEPGTGRLTARPGARLALNLSGGAIPDRGLYAMRARGSNARIGELDEEFVRERSIGDAFTFGTRAWKIVGIGDDSVEVAPLPRNAAFMPFWRADAVSKSPEVARALPALVERLDSLDPESARAHLRQAGGFTDEAALAATEFLDSQRKAQGGVGLPGTGGIVLETWIDPAVDRGVNTVVIHTLAGAGVNRTLAMLLPAFFSERDGIDVAADADETSCILQFPAREQGSGGLADPAFGERRREEALSLAGRVVEALRDLSDPRERDRRFRARLESSTLFAARFREDAARALLLPRGTPSRRVPLWVTRRRARSLFEAVRGFADFPILAETWRNCVEGCFDPGRAGGMLEDLARGRMTAECFAGIFPSPFASSAAWRTEGSELYGTDDLGGSSSSLSGRVLAEAIGSSRLRPAIPPSLVGEFVRRKKRLLPGWAPDGREELAAWVRERVLVPEDEMEVLRGLLPGGGSGARMEDADQDSLMRTLRLPGATMDVHVHGDRAGAVLEAPGAWLYAWLGHEGPVTFDRVRSVFGFDPEAASSILAPHVQAGRVIVDRITAQASEPEIVAADILEELLLRLRSRSRPSVESRPARDLFPFIAAVQGIAGYGARTGAPDHSGTEVPGVDLGPVLDRLSGYPAPARLWETEILPARLPDFRPAMLDALLASEARTWLGTARETVVFCPAWAIEDILAVTNPPATGRTGREQAGGDPAGIAGHLLPDGSPLDFWGIHDRSGLGIDAVVDAIWEEVWRGRVTADSFEPVRRGLASGFEGVRTPHSVSQDRDPRGESPGYRAGRMRRVPAALGRLARERAPLPGLWFLTLPAAGSGIDSGADATPAADALDGEEACIERVRSLAARYGILTPQLFARELPGLTWRAHFPALRRMELSGEMLYGKFFEDVDGPQFLAASALPLFHSLEERLGAQPVWLSALDPASPAGFPFPGEVAGRFRIPARLASTRLCMRGTELLAVSTGGTMKEIVFFPGAAENPDAGVVEEIVRGIAAHRARLRTCRGGGYPASGRQSIARVDGLPASRSPFADIFIRAGFDRDRDALVLW